MLNEETPAVPAEPTAAMKAMKISDILTRLKEIRDARQAISKQDSALVEEWQGLESFLIQRLDAEGTMSVSSTTAQATAVITEADLPMAEDWDAIEEWIYETRSLHMLQRRLATGTYRELLAAGMVPPGIRPIKKRSISLTTKK